jgi:hypothetical protein
MNDSAKKIHENNKSKGFWAANDRSGRAGQNVGELLVLIVSELGEAWRHTVNINFAICLILKLT